MSRSLAWATFVVASALVAAGSFATHAFAATDPAATSSPASPTPGGSSPASLVSPSATPVSSPNAISAPCVTAPSPLDIGDALWLVRVTQSGGLLYRRTDAIVRSDGAAWVDGCAITLAPAALARVAAAVAAADEKSWKRAYLPANQCCDQITSTARIIRKDGAAKGLASTAISSTIAGAAPGFYALVRAVENETYQYTAFAQHMRMIAKPAASP